MLAIAFTATTSAADGSPAKISIVNPSPIAAVIKGGADHHMATLTVLVANSGDSATPLTASALIDDSSNPGCEQTQLPSRITGARTVAAHQTAPVTVVLTLAQSCSGRSGTLVLHGDPGVDPATVRFNVTRVLGAAKTAIPGFIALALAAATLLWFFKLTDGRRWFIDADVAIAPSWTISGSWLTNIGVITGILGAVLGAGSGYLSDLVPGLSTQPFVGLSLAFTGVLVGAPIIYYALSKQQYDPATNKTVTLGTARALTALMIVTVFAVYGELATVGLLVYESNRPWLEVGPLLFGLALAIAATGVYAVRSTRDIVKVAITSGNYARLSGAAL
jgi:hypothetical protein